MMPEDEIDRVLRDIINTQKDIQDTDIKRGTGVLLKAFYAKVEKSVVDGQMVKQRAEALLTKP